MSSWFAPAVPGKQPMKQIDANARMVVNNAVVMLFTGPIFFPEQLDADRARIFHEN